MNYFIIGDIHGCYHTFIEALKHWNSSEEYLISVGDLIDRGNYSTQVVNKCISISNTYPNSIFLKGNHEAEIIEHFEKGYNQNWIDQCGKQTLAEFESNYADIPKMIEWFKRMPLKFEQEALMVTHAGIADIENPFEENHEESVLWNRSLIKNIGKLQVHGHTPLKNTQPFYNAKSNAWNIDSGAYYGYGLTALKISSKGELIEVINTASNTKDIL